MKRKNKCLLLGLLLAMAVLVGSCLSQDQGDLQLQEARRAFNSGQYLEAEKLFEQYLQTHPHGDNRWEAWHSLLDISSNVMANPMKSASLLEAMYLEFGDDAERAWTLLNRLANTYLAMGRWEQAVKTLKKTLAAQPAPERVAELHQHIASIYRHQYEYDLAQDALGVCIENATDPEVRARCMYEQAQTLGYMERVDRTKELLREVMDLQGVGAERKALAAFALADIAEQEGRRQDAVDLLETIVTTYPNPLAVQKRLEHLRKAMKESED